MTAKPHPHADLLHAIANGEQMEIRNTRTDCWVTETSERALQVIFNGYGEYVRIKPAKREARRWFLHGGCKHDGVEWPAVTGPHIEDGEEIQVREVLPDEQ